MKPEKDDNKDVGGPVTDVLYATKDVPRDRNYLKKYGMHAMYRVCVFAIIFLAALCGIGTTKALGTELITNGGFESGTTGWNLSSSGLVSSYGGLAHSPAYYLWFGDDNGTDSAYQTVTIPGNATAATLSFYYNINTSETSGTPDTLSASIQNSGGTSTLATVGAWTNLNGTTAGVYSQWTFNLLPYAGQTIRIYFVSHCTLTGSKTTNFRIDDVSAQVTSPVQTAPTISTASLPSGTQNTYYTQTMVATGGTTPYSWSLYSGVLPSGLSLNSSGTMSGTPTVATTANFTVQVTGGNGLSSTKALSFTINAQTIAPVTLTLYVHSGSSSGPVLPGALVTGSDGAGNSFNQTTNSGGYVTVTGTPGTWQFTASDVGYTTTNWTQSITATASLQAFLALTSSGSRVLGIDVSHVRGSINWSIVAARETFAIIKATDGYRTSQTQPMFEDPNFAKSTGEMYAPNAKQAGLKVGAYHFARPYINSAKDEADFFLSVAGNYIGPGYLPPALDIEDPDDDAPHNQVSSMDPAVLSQWIRDWCTEVENAKHVKPMIYTYHSLANTFAPDLASSYLLWIAYYETPSNVNPVPIGSWGSSWSFLQYSKVGHTLDDAVQNPPELLDVFNGDITTLTNLVNGGTRTDTTPPSPNPSTWATPPYATGTSSISMTATTASDPSGVQYFFHNLTISGHDSGWQTSATYTDTGLSVNTSYTYQVATRDQSLAQNQGLYSTSASATTQQVAASQVNLTPYLIPGWSEKVVVTRDNGVVSIAVDAANLTTADSLYVDWAVINNGSQNITNTFHTEIYVDSVLKYTVSTSSIAANYYYYWTNYPLGSLSAGSHYIMVKTDSGNEVAETNESDNIYTKTITVNAAVQFASLTVQASPSNGGTVTGSGSYQVGSSQQINATAYSGWTFTSWNDGNTQASRTITIPAGGATYTANFTQSAKIISLSGNLAFGNVTIGSSATRVLAITNPGNATLTVGSINYPAGYTGTWPSGTIAAGGTQNVTIILTPTAATTYNANLTVNCDSTSGTNFVGLTGAGVSTPTYAATPTAGANGAISPNTVQTVNSGGSETFTATPYPNYVVNQWLVNGGVAQIGGTSFTLGNVTATTSVQVTFKAEVITSLFFQNGTSLGILNLNATFLPSAWIGIGALDTAWQERAISDLNGDGVPDIIFQNGTLIAALIMDESGNPSSWVGIGSMNPGWQLRGAANIQGNDQLDLIFQNGTSIGFLAVNTSGVPVTWNAIGAVGTNWELRAVADLNADGHDELLFQNGTYLGALEVGTNGLPTAWHYIGTMSTGWKLSDAVDLNADGQPDLVFQSGTSLGALQVNTSFQPVAWHGIGTMGSGWILPGDY